MKLANLSLNNRCYFFKKSYPVFLIKKFNSESEIARRQWPFRQGPNILKQSYLRSLKPFNINLGQCFYHEHCKNPKDGINESTANAREATSSIDVEVSVCAYVCVNCEISVKCFQRLLNYLINIRLSIPFFSCSSDVGNCT